MANPIPLARYLESELQQEGDNPNFVASARLMAAEAQRRGVPATIHKVLLLNHASGYHENYNVVRITLPPFAIYGVPFSDLYIKASFPTHLNRPHYLDLRDSEEARARRGYRHPHESSRILCEPWTKQQPTSPDSFAALWQAGNINRIYAMALNVAATFTPHVMVRRLAGIPCCARCKTWLGLLYDSYTDYYLDEEQRFVSGKVHRLPMGGQICAGCARFCKGERCGNPYAYGFDGYCSIGCRDRHQKPRPKPGPRQLSFEDIAWATSGTSGSDDA